MVTTGIDRRGVRTKDKKKEVASILDWADASWSKLEPGISHFLLFFLGFKSDGWQFLFLAVIEWSGTCLPLNHLSFLIKLNLELELGLEGWTESPTPFPQNPQNVACCLIKTRAWKIKKVWSCYRNIGTKCRKVSWFLSYIGKEINKTKNNVWLKMLVKHRAGRCCGC